MSVSIRNHIARKDPIARAHHRASLVKAFVYCALVVAFIGGGTWFVFASSSFAVTTVLVEGASDRVNSDLRSAIDDVLGKRTLGFLRPARNILLLDENSVAALLSSTFKNVDEVRVEKKYPHTLTIKARERTPIGTWCHDSECQYFDGTGARWGSAVPSKGPILLFVQDNRTSTGWDERLFTSLMNAVRILPDMGLHPISITLPDTAPGDLWIRVNSGYDLILDALADIQDQLDTLAVFVADKAKDASWKPQYIDLRTPGRVYYK